MARLSHLLTLESMLLTYDSMSNHDAELSDSQGLCIEKLVDGIVAKLNRLLESKTRLSCRNVVLANFETMTQPSHWLNSKLFDDLPRPESKALKKKIEEMVELIRQLMVKIIDVDPDYADRLFEKLKKRCEKKSTTDYQLWKVQQPELSMDLLTQYQAELTAKTLMTGILKFDRTPKGEEMEGVDIERLMLKLDHNKELPEWFKAECAKLRRYSYWQGEMFFVDYKKLRKYIILHLGQLTCDQLIAMYDFDVQMRQLHQDMVELLKEHPSITSGTLAVEEKAVEKCFRFPNDFTRIQIDAMVKGAYQGSYANLALIEIALFHHRQLKRRNSHKAFVMALNAWGIIEIADTGELDRIVSGVRDKYGRLPEEGYLEWSDNFKNDRLVCERMGGKLGPTMPYQK